MCLIKKDKVYPRIYPSSVPHTFQWDASYFCWKTESDGISNGSIIIVCFSFWQKISSRSSRWSKLVWVELIRGNQQRDYTFNSIDATPQRSFISIYLSYGPCRALYFIFLFSDGIGKVNQLYSSSLENTVFSPFNVTYSSCLWENCSSALQPLLQITRRTNKD